MPDEPSLTQAVREWIELHGFLDWTLQVVVLALLLLTLLVVTAALLYCAWWLVRLSKRQNVQTFITRPIPGLRRGRIVGQEFEVGDLASIEIESLRATRRAVEDLNLRMGVVEDSIKKLETALHNLQEVSGRA